LRLLQLRQLLLLELMDLLLSLEFLLKVLLRRLRVKLGGHTVWHRDCVLG
jgi:hypothetical protein